MKKIEFVHEGKDYILCFTRRSAAEIAKHVDFDISEQSLNANSDVQMQLLFWGALKAKNPTKKEVSDRILREFSNTKNLCTRLIKMYLDASHSLMLGEEEGNIAWSADWEMEDED